MFAFFRLLLVFCVVSSLAAPAFAQQDAQKKPKAYAPRETTKTVYDRTKTDSLTRPHYEWMARQALAYQPPSFKFGVFRNLYAKTPQYDPFADVRREILNLAYEAQNEKDPAKRTKLFDDYAALVSMHMANMDIMAQALTLAEEDRRFGDPEFFRWMRKGLLKSVLSSGDGASLNRAYDVITMGEETALFNALPLKMLDVKTEQSSGWYYNMHSVEDDKHTAPYTIFVNITTPMRWLDDQKRRAGVNLNLKRQ